jgi:hypothetical protein
MDLGGFLLRAECLDGWPRSLPYIYLVVPAASDPSPAPPAPPQHTVGIAAKVEAIRTYVRCTQLLCTSTACGRTWQQPRDRSACGGDTPSMLSPPAAHALGKSTRQRQEGSCQWSRCTAVFSSVHRFPSPRVVSVRSSACHQPISRCSAANRCSPPPHRRKIAKCWEREEKKNRPNRG